MPYSTIRLVQNMFKLHDLSDKIFPYDEEYVDICLVTSSTRRGSAATHCGHINLF